METFCDAGTAGGAALGAFTARSSSTSSSSSAFLRMFLLRNPDIRRPSCRAHCRRTAIGGSLPRRMSHRRRRSPMENPAVPSTGVRHGTVLETKGRSGWPLALTGGARPSSAESKDLGRHQASSSPGRVRWAVPHSVHSALGWVDVSLAPRGVQQPCRQAPGDRFGSKWIAPAAMVTSNQSLAQTGGILRVSSLLRLPSLSLGNLATPASQLSQFGSWGNQNSDPLSGRFALEHQQQCLSTGKYFRISERKA